MSNKSLCFYCFVKKKDNHNEVIERIHFLNSQLEKLKKILDEKISYKNNSLTVVEFTKKYESYFSLKWDECFLCKSYFLTLFKKINAQATYTCSYSLAHFFEVSKKSSEKIIRQYQLHLAILSCQFIQTIAFDLNINKNNSPSIIFSISSDDDGRMVYPCFFSSNILLMHMKKTRCTVLIMLETVDGDNSRKDLILFEKGETQGHLLDESNSSIKENVCIVVIGRSLATTPISPSELLKKLNYFGLYDILLMNMAAHPQFSGSKLIPFANQLVPDITKLTSLEKAMEAEFLALKSDAHKYGFCQDNPSMLLIKHIFMDTIQNQITIHQTTNYTSVREPVDI